MPNVVYVSGDLLFPTNSGGRSAALGDCRALLEAGFEVNLIAMHREDLPAGALEKHLTVASNVLFMRRKNFLRSSARHPLMPYQLSSRLGSAEMRLWCSTKIEDPSAVVASQEWTLLAAQEIAQFHDIGLILRSQNDEVTFMRALASNLSGARRVYAISEAAKLKRLLRSITRSVSSVAVLSSTDSRPYAALGIPTSLVPPVLQVELSRAPALPTDRNTILFVGALDMPQAVAGLLWFVDSVLPSILLAVPSARLVVAGRRSSAELQERLSKIPGVDFLGEVANIDGPLAEARVFINPVFAGSGVNMKVGPPADAGVPIVTTEVGARGLDLLSAGLCVATSADEFSTACVQLFDDDTFWLQKSRMAQAALNRFSVEEVGNSFKALVAGES